MRQEFGIEHAMDGARKIIAGDTSLLHKFKEIHCSCYHDPNSQEYLFETVSRIANGVAVYSDPTISPGSVEFRAKNGLLLVGIIRLRNGNYAAMRAPAPAMSIFR